MRPIMNYPNDKTCLENNIAYIRAVLMHRYIENLPLNDEEKKYIKKRLVEELQKTWKHSNTEIGWQEKEKKNENYCNIHQKVKINR